jgi:signal transduction histidine kinase/ActR/RegA family two-component response regulator
MSDSDDIVRIIEDSDELAAEGQLRPWKIAVIDDDPAVHEGTRFALSDYSLNGRGLEIVSAHSAAEGLALMRDHEDVAAVLLDVIMETDSAGLDLVDFIRNELKNETVRIILRTGQPGQAPERRVIVDYDINDYKAKTELTADKLFTSLTAALRSYEQLHRMMETRRGLEIIIDAASTLFDFRSMQRLAEGVLVQIASVLNADCAGILVLRDDGHGKEGFSVLAGSGCYRDVAGGSPPLLDGDLKTVVEEAFRRRRHDFLAQRSILYIETGSGREVVVLLEAARHLSDTDRTLVEIFASRLSIAFDNVILYQQLQEANATLEARVMQRTTDLTAANVRLAAQWQLLQRANAFKREILGTVAHDLKNPLAVVMGRTEMLKEMVGNSAITAENLLAQVDHIRNATSRMTGMVNSLISDAMADALDISIRKGPVDLVAMVQSVAEANQPTAARKKQALTVTAPPRLVISCDADRIREAIDNLVSNAIKYSPTSGKIEVVAAEEAGAATVSVIDQGPGLSPEDLSRLFGRFQRLSAKPTGGESSAGLGLSIVKRIVDLHEGSISASNSAGPGTTFTITLPTS